jgi:hypothetical protein
MHDDAAYVLGALSDSERLEFEAHLADCAECQERVASIRPVAGLLADLTIDDLRDVPLADTNPPDTLLPALRAKIRRERRRRWVGGSVAGLAAACIATLVLVVASDRGNDHQPPAQAMTSLVSTPVQATARLEDTAWGTRISLACKYDITYPVAGEYSLVVTDRTGAQHGAGSWRLVQNGTTNFTGGTAVARSDIQRIDITVGNKAILELTL